MAMPAVGTETPRSEAKPGSTPMLANSVVPIASPPRASAARLTPAGTRERRVGALLLRDDRGRLGGGRRGHAVHLPGEQGRDDVVQGVDGEVGVHAAQAGDGRARGAAGGDTHGRSPRRRGSRLDVGRPGSRRPAGSPRGPACPPRTMSRGTSSGSARPAAPRRARASRVSALVTTAHGVNVLSRWATSSCAPGAATTSSRSVHSSSSWSRVGGGDLGLVEVGADAPDRGLGGVAGHHGQHGGGVDAPATRPRAPGALDGGVGVDQGAVHVQQHGREGPGDRTVEHRGDAATRRVLPAG